jgi:hypothetical protein
MKILCLPVFGAFSGSEVTSDCVGVDCGCSFIWTSSCGGCDCDVFSLLFDRFNLDAESTRGVDGNFFPLREIDGILDALEVSGDY